MVEDVQGEVVWRAGNHSRSLDVESDVQNSTRSFQETAFIDVE